MVHLTFLLLFSSFVALGPILVNSVADVSGECKELTPPMFEDTFIKNCKNLKIDEDQCKISYSNFSMAFIGRDQTAIQREDYNPYYDSLPIQAEKDQSLFWSGTFPIVSALSRMEGVNIVSSENTAAGRILNDFNKPNLCWCSEPGNPGLIENVNCTRPATSLFWAQFSVRFAQAAIGTIYFLADGERKPAYNTASFFGCYELENLRMGVVTRLVALNIHQKDAGEACGTGSYITLKENATSLKLDYTCYDLYGHVNTESHQEPLAECVQKVIERIQMGKETGQLQITCVSGGLFLKVSSVFLMLSLLLSFIAQ